MAIGLVCCLEKSRAKALIYDILIYLYLYIYNKTLVMIF